MIPLPIDPLEPAVLASLKGHRCLVIVAPPGAGKTTRVPPWIVRSGLLAPEHPALVMLQPRRVAARAAAARIAQENGWSIGEEVGYHVRFERKVGPRTRLRVVTEGILTRQLVVDPFLQGIGAVVLDEFHERSLHTDLAASLLREVRETVRDDLILIVMSATLDAEPVAAFLGGCPILRAEGRSYPVEIEYMPFPAGTALPQQVDLALDRIASEGGRREPGDVLVFLPGAEEIRRTARQIEPMASRQGWEIIPLHGSLTSEEQDRALRPAEHRKVILATNLAETSLTIQGIDTVIDLGLARFAGHDPARGVDRLELGRISRASASQRAGRAGRTGPGRCFRLWSRRDERSMPEFDEPEIRRVDLAATVLTLHAWGHLDPRRFGWFEAPPEANVAGAERLLGQLGALDSEGRLTHVGQRLLALPVHPRLGRLLLAAAARGLLPEGAALAALMTEKDIVSARRLSPRGDGPVDARGRSDLLHRLDLLSEFEGGRSPRAARAPGLDPSAVRRVLQVRDELMRIGRRFGEPAARHEERNETEEDDLLQLALYAYPDRIVRRRGHESTGVMVGGRGVRIEPESIVREAEYFLAIDPRDDRRHRVGEARVRIASEVRVEWLEEAFPGSVREERTYEFDEQRGRTVAIDTLWYRDLPLRQDRSAIADPKEASAALADALGQRAQDFIREDESAAAWLDRLECVRSWVPEEPWPAFDDEKLAEIVASACAGRKTVEEVRTVPFVPLLKGSLTHEQASAMDRLVPETLVVPSGSRIRLSYEVGRPPVLAVRLQELFGWTETPRIARGRVAVLLHLLGPNLRPVQITDDLRSFWTTTYHQVRKDLRVRYPKHAWPEDPWSARAEAKGGRRS